MIRPVTDDPDAFPLPDQSGDLGIARSGPAPAGPLLMAGAAGEPAADHGVELLGIDPLPDSP